MNNVSVRVEEGSKVTLDQAALQIIHPNIAPSEISYHIVQRPQHGYLEVNIGDSHESKVQYGSAVLPQSASTSRDNGVRVFEYEDIEYGQEYNHYLGKGEVRMKYIITYFIGYYVPLLKQLFAKKISNLNN